MRVIINVVDLSLGHVIALLANNCNCKLTIDNLGTGHGYSVIGDINASKVVNGDSIPYRIKLRCLGCIACCYCDTSKVEQELG